MNYNAAASRAAKKVQFPILVVLSRRLCLAYAPPENEAVSGYIKGSKSRPVQKRCVSISAVILILSKPASHSQVFCSSSIRKRRIRPSLCVAVRSLTRIHSRRRQLVAFTSVIIWPTSLVCQLPRAALTAASHSPGSLRFPSDNGSRDAPPIGVSSALFRSAFDR